ncbi:MAG: Fur family transcriptional regulator [Bacteroidota bacterium]
MPASKDILKSHGLRYTSAREQILQIFQRREGALSQREIESALVGTCDRVTVYRTLSSFQEKGLVHRVLDDSGVMKFALCPAGCDHSTGESIHNHAHFKCVQCDQVLCLDNVALPTISSLPSGFLLQETHVLLQGLCPQCSEQ